MPKEKSVERDQISKNYVRIEGNHFSSNALLINTFTTDAEYTRHCEISKNTDDEYTRLTSNAKFCLCFCLFGFLHFFRIINNFLSPILHKDF